jgi:hypothetical protein
MARFFPIFTQLPLYQPMRRRVASTPDVVIKSLLPVAEANANADINKQAHANVAWGRLQVCSSRRTAPTASRAHFTH